MNKSVRMWPPGVRLCWIIRPSLRSVSKLRISICWGWRSSTWCLRWGRYRIPLNPVKLFLIVWLMPSMAKLIILTIMLLGLKRRSVASWVAAVLIWTLNLRERSWMYPFSSKIMRGDMRMLRNWGWKLWKKEVNLRN